MEYSIKPIEGQHYLQVTYSGVADLDVIERSKDDLEELVQSLGWYRILVDNTQLSITLSIARQFEILKALPWRSSGKIKSAILIRSEELERFSFIEDVAVNRGSMVKVFLDRQPALDWLLEE